MPRLCHGHDFQRFPRVCREMAKGFHVSAVRWQKVSTSARRRNLCGTAETWKPFPTEETWQPFCDGRDVATFLRRQRRGNLLDGRDVATFSRVRDVETFNWSKKVSTSLSLLYTTRCGWYERVREAVFLYSRHVETFNPSKKVSTCLPHEKVSTYLQWKRFPRLCHRKSRPTSRKVGKTGKVSTSLPAARHARRGNLFGKRFARGGGDKGFARRGNLWGKRFPRGAGKKVATVKRFPRVAVAETCQPFLRQGRGNLFTEETWQPFYGRDVETF